MKSLKALSDYLRELEYINDDAFESWAEEGEIEFSGSQELAGEEPVILLYRLPYVAVFSWEAWHGDPYQLFGDIVVWLKDQGYDFDQFDKPKFDAEMLDDETADIEIKITFEDAVYSQPLVQGEALTLVDTPEPTAVEEFELCGSTHVPTD